MASTTSGLDRLIDELRLWHGGLSVQPGNFSGWSLGARFYPMLYILTRVGEAKDWGSGLTLREGMFGKMSQLEVHHIFPKAVLYKHGYARADVNAVANFCFLTKDTNLKISATRPEEYFPQVEAKHPGALASQWIPQDSALWGLDRYPDFLEARRELLARATNAFLQGLLHGEALDAGDQAPSSDVHPVASTGTSQTIPGAMEGPDEEQLLKSVNDWLAARGLPPGTLAHELSEQETGSPLAVLDLAWPDGLQRGLTEPICLLLDEPRETLAAASQQGFRCFQSVADFEAYVDKAFPALEAVG